VYSPAEAGWSALAASLNEAGFAPFLLTDPDQALQLTRIRRPDLLLLRASGSAPIEELVQRLKLDPRTSLLPLVVVTPARSSPPHTPGWHVAPDRCLVEPVAAPELLAVLREERQRIDSCRQRGVLAQVHLELRSEIRCLSGLSELLMAMFSHTNLTDVQVHQLLTAVREIATNCIEWGHRGEADRLVELTYTLHPDRVDLVFRDSGPGFNPTNLPHAASTDDPTRHLTVRAALGIREGGFGIMMTRGLVDELRYNERGNEAILVKYFAPPLRQEAS
jgi:anti-sigma regulatory factor (Ser/Thr protein kinase)